jgi:hypothetical protein
MKTSHLRHAELLAAAEQEFDQIKEEQTAEDAEEAKVQEYVKDVCSKYEFLNHLNPAKANAEVIAEVREIAAAFVCAGRSRLDAIAKAVDLVVSARTGARHRTSQKEGIR